MRRYFNTEGKCMPDVHYMVNIDKRLEKIKCLYVDRGKYFVINRGRQYGKTTTLMALEQYLKNDYMVIFLDFQTMSDDSFRNGSVFARSFANNFRDSMNGEQKETVSSTLQELSKAAMNNELNLESLFVH